MRCTQIGSALERFLVSLGINKEVNTGPLVNALGSVLDLKQQLTSLASNDSPSFDEISGVLNAANKISSLSPL